MYFSSIVKDTRFKKKMPVGRSPVCKLNACQTLKFQPSPHFFLPDINRVLHIQLCIVINHTKRIPSPFPTPNRMGDFIAFDPLHRIPSKPSPLIDEWIDIPMKTGKMYTWIDVAPRVIQRTGIWSILFSDGSEALTNGVHHICSYCGGGSRAGVQ